MRLTPVVKGLLLLNIAMFLLTLLIGKGSYDISNPMVRYCALFFPKSELFHPYQFVSYMFMHGGFMHILFNMYALFIFGSAIEYAYGSKRFLFYYLFTGLGAAALHTGVNFYLNGDMMGMISSFEMSPDPESFKLFIDQYRGGFTTEYVSYLIDLYQQWTLDPGSAQYAPVALGEMHRMSEAIYSVPTVGASGSVYGVLIAFGMTYPNQRLMLLIPPIPIKAKWMVLGYCVLELLLGISQPGSPVAHFAHIGGMLFGFLLIKYWRRKDSNFYEG